MELERDFRLGENWETEKVTHWDSMMAILTAELKGRQMVSTKGHLKLEEQ